MQNYIQVNNFRKYVKTPEIGLNNLNFFVGTNSSGKSSIVKAYMLILTYIKLNKFYDIDFASTEYQDLNIQDFSRLKCQFSDKSDNVKITLLLNTFKFELVLTNHEKPNFARVLSYVVTDLNNDIVYEYNFFKGRIISELHPEQDDEDGIPIYNDVLNEHDFKIKIVNNHKYINQVKKVINFLINKEEDEIIKNYYMKDLESLEFIENFIESSDKKEKQIIPDINLKQNIFDGGAMSINDFKLEVNTVLKGLDLPSRFKQYKNKNYSISYDLNDKKYKEELLTLIPDYRLYNVNDKNLDGSISLQDYYFDETGCYFKEKNDGIILGSGMELTFKQSYLYNLINKVDIVFLPLIYRRYTNINSITDKSNDLAKLLHTFYNASTSHFQQDFYISMANDFINHWISKDRFNIGDGFEINFFGGEAYEILILENGCKIPLVDKGTGNIQIFKILLIIAIQIKKVEFKSTLIFEEPELNLHPGIQSKLADLFIEINNLKLKGNRKPKFNVFVETHSEYLIRRLQVLVSKKVINNEKLSITYFPSELNKQPYQLAINKDGSLDKNFGTGFFDEASNHTLELIKYKRLSQN